MRKSTFPEHLLNPLITPLNHPFLRVALLLSLGWMPARPQTVPRYYGLKEPRSFSLSLTWPL
jgi:hypothetical protein